MEALLSEAMTACTTAYVHAWHGLLAWARAVDTMMGGIPWLRPSRASNSSGRARHAGATSATLTAWC